MSDVLIGIDTGKSNTKYAVYGENGDIITREFPTSCDEASTRTRMGSVSEIVFNNTRYLVGESASNSTTANAIAETKTNDVHRLCFLTAIASALAELPEPKKAYNVTATLNMPFMAFLDAQQKEDAEAFFGSSSVISLEYNGKLIKFTLDLVTYFEGLGAIILEDETFRNGQVLSLDFGSKNVGYCSFNGGEPNPNECGTLTFGVRQLYEKVRVILRSNGFTSAVSDENISAILLGKNNRMTPAILEQVDGAVYDHVSAIYASLINNSVNVQFADVVISGGASILYKKALDRVFEEHNTPIRYTENQVFANAIGSLKLITV